MSRGTCISKRITLYKYHKKYKAGDTIVIETDSKEYLQQAKKEYARKRKRKTKKTKRKSSKN